MKENIDLDDLKIIFGIDYDTLIATLEEAYTLNDEIHLVVINEFHKMMLKNKYIKLIERHFDPLKVIIDIGVEERPLRVIDIYHAIGDMFDKYKIPQLDDVAENIVMEALSLAYRKGKMDT